MLNKLKKLNSDINIYSVFDKEFSKFGRVIDFLDTNEIVNAAEKIEKPESGSKYTASEEKFEALDIAEEIKSKIFGNLPTQVGYCWGHNSKFNATEWHFSSELNIAVTPMVLILGNIWDVENRKIDISKYKAFYVPKGTAIEVYATSLHFCPCETQNNGFGSVVALPKGTNTPIANPTEDKLLFANNKWLLAHIENKNLIARGSVAGVTGKNIEIKY